MFINEDTFKLGPTDAALVIKSAETGGLVAQPIFKVVKDENKEVHNEAGKLALILSIIVHDQRYTSKLEALMEEVIKDSEKMG